MTREDTMKILVTMQAAYPNYKPLDKTATLNTWAVLLQEYTYEQVSTALKSYITSDMSGFAPAIGQLIGMIQKLNEPQVMNELEAWSFVSRALRNGFYGAEVEFAKLPPLVQKAVGSADNLRNWSQTGIESVENVIQSNFLRTYRTVVQREAEISRMPQEIRQLVSVASVDTPCLDHQPEETIDPVEKEHVCAPAPDGLLQNLKKELMET